jgi:lipid intermediate transporter
MPICITCCTPVKHLYTTYSKADDRSLGKGVRLTQCPHCKRFADKYVEHDFVVLFIDLVLIKPQVSRLSCDFCSLKLSRFKVYRHLLFNRLGRADDKLDPSILRLGTLLLLFDVYLTWARIENTFSAGPNTTTATNLNDAPILLQYLFFLTLNTLATFAHHVTVRLLVRIFLSRTSSEIQIDSPKTEASNSPGKQNTYDDLAGSAQAKEPKRTAGPGLASPSAISTALLVSSCTKLFPILLVIWPEPTSEESHDNGLTQSFASRARSYVGWAVLLNNIEALLILLDCGYVAAMSLALAGTIARWMVERVVLGLAGLEGDGGPIGDIMAILAKALNFLPGNQS